MLLANMAVSCGMCPGQRKLQFGGRGAQLETTNLGATEITKGEDLGESQKTPKKDQKGSLV